MDTLKTVLSVAASGMRAQGERLKVVSENVANASSTGNSNGEDPYRRKIISFQEMVDRDSGASMVEVDGVRRDDADFQLNYDPSHPAADEDGFVKVSNVNTILEMSNMREASRSYQANLNMFETGRSMRSQLLDLLK
ncbi:flagellar basal body rod protein FlgC [Salipiger bermudensis]|uniref:Flagellar basal-body rod protein FlgC n=1 Tax=Salipiger bermudensis (strain DSM 26914 / JCM 13377 / KCTC 12554 / HTCC2601) TaxID=314265 RepID=Q0FML2_SALBH|nr:flagellar basal body rod protein FlgC [Salipiger bermudensis]EAU45386.1 flagellar basal-body rod protein C [Salipiger bermudensis HTCC2601]MBN9677845.1 flagellar basal body rod protein FlgC [Salipiger bermudensis]MBR9893202.1 flagellar basal body rod protein FlgC [bacterium]MCA1287791.1 flagellar basal body rod protein FlgC [Salipiger bermudensis]